jgi:rhodanese-related sulfurtransferase
VPGAFGTLQALLTLKILLQMGGQLDGELLLLDFMNFSSLKIKASRRAECRAPACAHIQDLAREDHDIEVSWDSLAAEHRFELIDIRTAEEVAAHPAAVTADTTVRHIPMHELLATPGLLAASRRPLLVCATGKRSLATAQALRKQGLTVRSLAGGLQNLER